MPEKKNSVDHAPNHATVTVAAKSTQALVRNGDRRAALFINDSSEIIYLSIGIAARQNAGIRLNANGGTYYMSSEDGNLDTDAVYAICASGNKKLLVTEWD